MLTAAWLVIFAVILGRKRKPKKRKKIVIKNKRMDKLKSRTEKRREKTEEIFKIYLHIEKGCGKIALAVMAVCRSSSVGRALPW